MSIGKSRLLSLVPSQLSRKQQDLINLNSGSIEALNKHLNDPKYEFEEMIKDREIALDLGLNRVAEKYLSILKEALSWDKLSVERINSDLKDPSIAEFIAFQDRARPVKRLQDVYKRIEGPDSRCYGLFNAHLRFPVSFVFLRLTNGLASKLSDLENKSYDNKDSCIFYSITSPFRGLKGIEFAGRLIKSVMSIVAEEVPSIEIFATFSPMPAFRAWLDSHSPGLTNLTREQVEGYRDELVEACRLYLNTRADPVTRFHLRNGAAIGPIRFLADINNETSFKQSYGIQVNYLYST